MLVSQSRPTPLRDDHARFYAASVVCGLEYMQDRNLMWRCALPSQRPDHETLCHEQRCTACVNMREVRLCAADPRLMSRSQVHMIRLISIPCPRTCSLW